MDPLVNKAVGVLSIDYQGFHSFKLKNTNLHAGDYDCYAHPTPDAGRVAELEDAHLPFEWMEGCSFYLGEVREVFGATATVVHGDDETRILIGEVLECDFRKKSEAIGAMRQELTERDARIAALEAQLAEMTADRDLWMRRTEDTEQEALAARAQLSASREREGRLRSLAADVCLASGYENARQAVIALNTELMRLNQADAALAAEKGEKE